MHATATFGADGKSRSPLASGRSVRVMWLESARRFALSLPETTEQPHFEKSSFRVKGKVFATVPVGGNALHVFVGEETSALAAEDAAAFEVIRSAKNRVVDDWVRVNLAAADSARVRELLEDAWRCMAPRRVLGAYDARRCDGP